MSRGLPVLASSAGGLPELIDSKYIHKPGDYKKLSCDILKILDNKELQVQGKRNFNRSGDFLPICLEKRRKVFWDGFFFN